MLNLSHILSDARSAGFGRAEARDVREDVVSEWVREGGSGQSCAGREYTVAVCGDLKGELSVERCTTSDTCGRDRSGAPAS